MPLTYCWLMGTARLQVLVTGAAGRVGSALLASLADRFTLRAFDTKPVPFAAESVVGNITDPLALDRAMTGVDVVIHLAANASKDATFAELAAPNVEGTTAVFEAARRNGVRRVIFASSNRSVELHSPLRNPWPDAWPVELAATAPPRPDSPYGVSKVFGEAVAGYFADVHGVSSVCLRLGSVDTRETPTVADKPRAWALWLSRRDLVELCAAAVLADVTGSVVVNACSANSRRWWELGRTTALLGYEPQDNSELFLHAGHRSLVPPPPPYRIPWGARLGRLAPLAGQAFLLALGQSGFWLRTAHTTLAVDPFLTVWPDRLVPPLLDAAELPVDYVVVTHTHRDHLDAPALATIAQARPATRFAGPPTVIERLRELGIDAFRLTTLLPGDACRMGDLTVTAVAARHRPTTPDAQGYVLTCSAGRVYHTGDTELDACLMAAVGLAPDVLLVPINGRKGNMTAEQAAQLTANLAVPTVVPMHYGVLQPAGDLVERFVAATARVAPTARVALMEPGSIAQLPLLSDARRR